MARARGRAWWVAGALAVVAAGCSSGGSDPTAGGPSTTTTNRRSAATTTTTIAWPKPTFAEADCPMPLTDAVLVDVTCGYVAVPENRLDPKSRTIKLAVAVLHSTAAHAKPDPVVNLQGGPGFPSLVNVEGASRSTILEHRDYILWDQRGTGFSVPNLDCPETNAAIWTIFETTDPAEAESKVVADATRRCRDRLLGEGVDLAGYNTVQNAADLADLRVALGIDEWNLRGISYGSALAIETMRSHPEGIHSVLLDSVVAPDEGFGGVGRGRSALLSFQQLYDACAADQHCADTYGDLHALFEKAAARLDATPYRTSIVDPATGDQHEVAITGQDLWAGLFNAMYAETLIPALPAAAKAIAGGDTGIIDALAQDGIPFAAGQAEGMTASVDCADRQRLLDPDAVGPFLADHPELAGLVRLTLPETHCPEVGVPSAPAGFNRLLTADENDVPVIVMAGRFDPITPVAGTRRVAEALGVPLLLFPNAGHGASTSSDCARGIWYAFLDDPTHDPDTSCMAELGPPAFA